MGLFESWVPPKPQRIKASFSPFYIHGHTYRGTQCQTHPYSDR
jgi:hypothetical protein